MEQVVIGIVTAVGAPLLLAGIVLLLAAILGHPIKIGPVEVPAPPSGKRWRWILVGILLIALAVAIIIAGLVALDRLDDGSDDGDNTAVTPTPTQATATATVSTVTPNPTAETPTLDDLTGEWRARDAAEGELFFLAINRGNSSTEATIEGSYQGSFGVILLPARDADFIEGVLVQDDPWIVETSVNQVRVASATRSGAALEVELERCTVGQLGTTCTSSSQTLVR